MFQNAHRSLSTLLRAALLAAVIGRAWAATPGPDVAGEPPASSPLDVRGRPSQGLATAPIVVIEVSSFKCAHCRAFHQKIFPRLRAQYIDTGKIHWIVLNASDDPSEAFTPVFAIARWAQQQGRYWDILDTLFQVAHRPPSFQADLVARGGVLERAGVEACLRDRAVRAAVDADFADYLRLKLRGTPGFVVSKTARDGSRTGAIIAGAQTLEYFQRVFDELLKTP